MKSQLAIPAILLGVALFVFSYFSYTPASTYRQGERGGSEGQGYETEPKLGMAAGAMLIVGGWLAYRRERR